ncbi:hypothetical protein SAMN02745664_11214 [Moraxella cuniculi DSM 21768]|uniref:2-methylaconitate cis-trans isomerase n=2 Tax=Moraxella cuniculi TaxID=34061 RepID=A0A1N7FCS0_9GAMM|nr:PrpF domain-containing protein [Moraxella cuniculi]OOS07129.1 hypothetical protein B0189_04060 [Moraxella cuniculi]SIR98151.1 hypothetical protein SAMN02745664_11214 [Moraxella cuniculi DSM 21768]VEG12311.1 3-methylitaconate isomerase [Moraxella cuniculi]
MSILSIKATCMRGGTSKCWVFERSELENRELPMEDILLRAFGSPDTRQLDGVGGGTSTTSKAVILNPYDGDDCDVNYLFAQVGIKEPTVDWGSNCGNCSAVVALYAIEKGWVTPVDGTTTVRVYNENTGQIIIQQIPTPDSKPVFDAEMVGSVYAGALVNIGFLDPAGKTTGKLFPTEQYLTELSTNGNTYATTLVDAGAPCVYVDAKSLGLDGKSRDEWTAVIDTRLSELDDIRRQASVLMGLSKSKELAAKAIPKLGVIGKGSNGADLRVQMLSMGERHPAMPVTGSVALTLSTQYDNSVPSNLLGKTTKTGISLDTPSGVLQTFATELDGLPVVGVARTARTICQAVINVPTSPRPTELGK